MFLMPCTHQMANQVTGGPEGVLLVAAELCCSMLLVPFVCLFVCLFMAACLALGSRRGKEEEECLSVPSEGEHSAPTEQCLEQEGQVPWPRFPALLIYNTLYSKTCFTIYVKVYIKPSLCLE